jgi:hypothetical protein
MGQGLLKTKVGVRGLRAPVWALAVAALGITAVAGQALGPVLAGSAGGNVGVVASQDLFFAAATATRGHDGDIDQAAANIDTAGMVVTAAFRMHRGDAASALTVNLENRSNNRRSSHLIVQRPAGTGVNVSSSDPDIQVAQRWSEQLPGGRIADCYLVVLDDSGDADIDLEVLVGTADPLGTHEIVLTLEEIP